MKTKTFIKSIFLVLVLISTSCSKEVENIVATSNGEINGKCGTVQANIKFSEEHPEFQNTQDLIKEHTEKYVEYVKENGESKTIITIPIVFHNLYKSNGTGYVAKRRMEQQIVILNKDFNGLNPRAGNIIDFFKPLEANVQINFVLHEIKRKVVSNADWNSYYSYGHSAKMADRGGSPSVDALKYCNIWITNLELKGMASYPGTTPRAYEGIVLNHKAVVGGPKAETGRVATHEMGHYLNLYHIFGKDQSTSNIASNCQHDDEVQDTPNTIGSPRATNCPNSWVWTCGSYDNNTNFMDYSNGGCQNMFTHGQRTRMRALFAPGGHRHAMTQ